LQEDISNTVQITRRAIWVEVEFSIVAYKSSKSCQPQVDDSLSVFVYPDREGYLAAITTLPLAQVDDIAYLKVAALNYVGAFLDWGLPKNLLVPFSEQYHELEVGCSGLIAPDTLSPIDFELSLSIVSGFG